MKTKRCKIGVLLLLLLLPGCSRQPVEAQVYAMDTLMTIKLWGSHGETAVQDLSRLFQEQEAQLSVTRPGSLVDRLNGGQTVELPEQIQDLFRETLALSNRTGGALDPCLYPVTKLWGFTTGHYRVPEQAEIQEALAHTGSKQLILKNSCAHLAAGAQMDLGAVGKGRARTPGGGIPGKGGRCHRRPAVSGRKCADLRRKAGRSSLADWHPGPGRSRNSGNPVSARNLGCGHLWGIPAVL